VPPECCDEWNAELHKPPFAKGRRVCVIAALSWVAVVAGLLVELSVVIYTAIIYANMIAYFALYSRPPPRRRGEGGGVHSQRPPRRRRWRSHCRGFEDGDEVVEQSAEALIGSCGLRL
jgi:hypothetical protein